MTDLLTQLQNYGREFTSAQEAITMKQLLEREPSADLRPTSQRRGWVVALASATSVIVVIGGLVLGLMVLTDDRGDVTTDPTTTVTTEAPATTTEATTTTTTTTTVAAQPLLPPTQAPPPYEGPVPELGSGWVLEAPGPGQSVASHPDLGLVAFGERETDDGMSTAQAFFSSDGTAWILAEGFEAPVGDPGPRVRFAAAGHDGFVAIVDSADGGEGPTAFYSANGTTWERTTLSWQGGGVNALTAGPSGYVVVGGAAACDGRSAFSADGRTWTAIRLPGGCLPGAVTWTGTHYVMVSVGAEGDVDDVFVSVDGAQWEAVEMQMSPGDVGLFGVYLAGIGETLVLAGDDTSSTPPLLSLWYSHDLGATWLEATIHDANGAPTGEYQTQHLIHSELGYFAVGGIETLTSASPGFLLWSPNGAEWFQFITDDGQTFGGIGVIDDTVIASGFGNGLWSWSEP